VTNRQFDPEQLVLAAGDAIIASDASGSIVFWNPAAERLFGYTQSEALGQSLDLIIPERLRGGIGRDTARSCKPGIRATAATKCCAFRAVHKDGRSLSIAFTVALLRAPGNAGADNCSDHP
jgi:PAS domain S-box-containing protein